MSKLNCVLCIWNWYGEMISKKNSNFTPGVFYTLNDLLVGVFLMWIIPFKLWQCPALGVLGDPELPWTIPEFWNQFCLLFSNGKTNVFSRLRGFSGVSLVECLLLCFTLCRIKESSFLGNSILSFIPCENFRAPIHCPPANCTIKLIFLILSN